MDTQDLYIILNTAHFNEKKNKFKLCTKIMAPHTAG